MALFGKGKNQGKGTQAPAPAQPTPAASSGQPIFDDTTALVAKCIKILEVLRDKMSGQFASEPDDAAKAVIKEHEVPESLSAVVYMMAAAISMAPRLFRTGFDQANRGNTALAVLELLNGQLDKRKNGEKVHEAVSKFVELLSQAVAAEVAKLVVEQMKTSTAVATAPAPEAEAPVRANEADETLEVVSDSSSRQTDDDGEADATASATAKAASEEVAPEGIGAGSLLEDLDDDDTDPDETGKHPAIPGETPPATTPKISGRTHRIESSNGGDGGLELAPGQD